MKFWRNKNKSAAPTLVRKELGWLPYLDRKYKDVQVETATFALG